MRISYNFLDNRGKLNFEQKNKEELEKNSLLLTNTKGDFLHFGVFDNCTKYFGYNIFESSKNKYFKIIDFVKLLDVEPFKVEYSGYKFTKFYKSKLLNEDNNEIKESYYLGPKGGLVLELENFEGSFYLDLDMREVNDFDSWGRNYNIYKKDNVIFIKYDKFEGDNLKYTIYFGIKSTNFEYDLIKEWIKKDYNYSKKRGSLSELYLYRLMKVKIRGDKKIFFGAGLDETEVLAQISMVEKHQNELEKLDKSLFKSLTKLPNFEILPPEFILNSYSLSNNAIYKYLVYDDLTNENLGSVAGFPWFTNVWTRDELVSLRAFINNGDFDYVKNRLFYYINNLQEDGTLKRLNYLEGSLSSVDGTFWLAKRLEDLIFELSKRQILSEVLTEGELIYIYDKLKDAFNKIILNYWDKDLELLKTKYGDSWMDTISETFTLDMQVLFLEFVSFLSLLSNILKKDESSKFEDLEFLLKEKIKVEYYDKESNKLFNTPEKNSVRSNVFLAYYLYPNLFSKKEWNHIIDKTLDELWNKWGSVSSLSHNHKDFKENYTGENNLSYHNGDVWFWINNLTAIVLNDLDSEKYKDKINQILISSSNDIFNYGTLGFGSEISSTSEQKAEGNLAQLWSSATFVEMVDKIFKKIN